MQTKCGKTANLEKGTHTHLEASSPSAYQTYRYLSGAEHDLIMKNPKV